MGVTRIDADHGQTGALEFMPEPARHGASFKTDAFGIGSFPGDDRRQHARIGFHPALVNGPSCLIDDANRRFLLRHVQSDIVLHGDAPPLR